MTSNRRLLRAACRRLCRPAAVVLALGLGAWLAGRWGAAVGAAAVGTVEMVAWWARSVDPRLFAPRFPSATTECAQRKAPDRDRHLAFARALAVVAIRYVAECERDGAATTTRERPDDR